MKKNVFFFLTIIYIMLFISMDIYSKSINNKFFGMYFINYVILSFIFFIIIKLKNIYNKLFIYFYLLWFLIGNINIIYSYKNTLLIDEYHFLHYLRSFDINTKIANNIYLIFLGSFCLAMYIFENIIKKEKLIINKKINCSQINLIIISLFPILCILEYYFNLGGLPIKYLKEGIITMYDDSINIGLINSKIGEQLCLFGGSYFYFKFIKNYYEFKKINYYSLLMILLNSIVLLASGKRYYFILFILSNVIISTKYRNNKIPVKQVLLLFVITLIIYLFMVIIRVGNNVNIENLKSSIKNIGIEYRDWAYLMENWNGYKSTYNWFITFFSGLISKKILKIIGINSVLEYKSVYLVSSYFNADWGIRIGIVGELFIYFGWYGIFIFSILAIIVAYFNNKLLYCNNDLKIIYLSNLYSINLLFIMGQSDVIASSIKSLIYIIIILFFIEKSLSIVNKKINKKIILE